MKSDTKDKVRVTVTLNRESDPAWFAYISEISSGRARAELLRRHLKSPPSLSHHEPVSDQADVARTQTIESNLQPVPEAKPVEATTSESKPAKQLKIQESSGAGEIKVKQRTRGALAVGMIASGNKTWE